MATYMGGRFVRILRQSITSKRCYLDASLKPCHEFGTVLKQTRHISQSTSCLVPSRRSTGRRQTQNEVGLCEDDPYKVDAEKCILCKHQVPVSYKNTQLLSQFVSPNTGRIFGKQITRLCDEQQLRVAKAIKRAVQMGFMPNMYRETRFLKDPSLYDVRYTGDSGIGQYTKLPDSPLSEEELVEAAKAPQSKEEPKS